MSFHACFHGLIRRLYYGRITISGAPDKPVAGPVLVLCLHRNGAVDGFLYRAAVPRLTYLIRARLRNNPIGRLFFSGVEIRHDADGGTAGEQQAMIEACLRHLKGTQPLAIFPEGTSKLGPRHLPFKSGAARVAHRHLAAGRPLTVLPLGIHYECPWAFRSRVEIVQGTPLVLERGDADSGPGGLKRRFARALEEVGFNVADQRTHDLAHRFAYVATLGTNHRFFTALKAMEEGLPEPAVEAWHKLEARMMGRVVLHHQDVPLFPTGPAWLYGLSAAVLALPVLGGFLLNLPPVVLGAWTGRRFADDTNVIALWRIFGGLPLFLLWAPAVLCLLLVLGLPWLAVGYFGFTTAGLLGWYRLKKLTVAAWNGLLHHDLRSDALNLHRLLLSHLQTTTRHEPDPVPERSPSPATGTQRRQGC